MSKILVFNWKMNPKTQSEAVNLFAKTESLLAASQKGNKIVICPPSIYLSKLSSLEDKNDTMVLSAQDISAFEQGAYTGDIAASMLADLQICHTLIGHSETRKANSLTGIVIHDKIKQALSHGITPILCIGYQNNKNSTEIDYEELESDIVLALSDQNLENGQEIWIAYEPIWAIGTGKTANPELIKQVIENLRQSVAHNFSQQMLSQVKFFYGGSLSEQNIAEFDQIDNLDGFLIGGASLVPAKIEAMLAAVA